MGVRLKGNWKYFELNENENTTYRNLQYPAEAVLLGGNESTRGSIREKKVLK